MRFSTHPLPPHLILVGASVRAAAESAARHGIAVTAVDMFGDVDTRRASRQWVRLDLRRDSRALCNGLPPGPVVLTGGTENWGQWLEPLRRVRTVLAPQGRAVRRVRSLRFLSRFARQWGATFPAWRRGEPSSGAHLWLVKSSDSAGGMQVRKWNPAEGQELSANRPSDRSTYYQRRLWGRVYGAAFLGHGSGADLLGVCRSLRCRCGERPFLYAGSVGPLALAPSDATRLRQAASWLSTQVGLRGLFGIDMLIPAAGGPPALLEINPRYTASMELLEPSHGSSLIAQHVWAFQEPMTAAMDSVASVPASRAKVICWARKPLRWRISDAERDQVTVHDYPPEGTRIEAGEPMATIIAPVDRLRSALRSSSALREGRMIP